MLGDGRLVERFGCVSDDLIEWGRKIARKFQD